MIFYCVLELSCDANGEVLNKTIQRFKPKKDKLTKVSYRLYD